MLTDINSDTYAKRIIEMMHEYKITMFDALLWDFESFCDVYDASMIYNVSGVNMLEREFRSYLTKNGIVTQNDKNFYTDIFMGRSNNMELNKHKEQ